MLMKSVTLISVKVVLVWWAWGGVLDKFNDSSKIISLNKSLV